MTLLDPPRAAPPTAAPMRPRRARRLITVVAVLALLAGGVVGGVAIRDAIALSQVHVFLDGRTFGCADPADVTTVQRGGDGEDGYLVPAVRGVTSLDCTLAVVIENDSDQDVAVQRVLFPLLGAGSAVGLRMDRSLTQGLAPSAVGDREDVLFDYARESPIGVGAHTTTVFRFHLGSTGCRQAGATTTWDDAPVVTLSTGIVTADVHREGVPFGFIGAKTAVQPCP